jgi:hypothetical protein
MAYTDTITYLKCPTLFDEGVHEFTPGECGHSPQMQMPDSPVYQRAKQVFNQSGYMYPAPPLYLGVREITFPKDTLYVLRLLIKEPGSNFMLPKTLRFLENEIKSCAAYQMAHFPDFAERFLYLTVRSGPVMSTHDDELHVDGFQGISVPRHIPEQNYLWTSSDPTLFSMQPYFVENLDPSKHNIHNHFESVTNKSMLLSGIEKGLYIIDPYHVHARQKVLEGTRRSMFRLCFSPVEICDDSNMVNKFLPRGPYNRPDIRNRLTDFDGELSDTVNGLRPTVAV